MALPDSETWSWRIENASKTPPDYDSVLSLDQEKPILPETRHDLSHEANGKEPDIFTFPGQDYHSGHRYKTPPNPAETSKSRWSRNSFPSISWVHSGAGERKMTRMPDSKGSETFSDPSSHTEGECSTIQNRISFESSNRSSQFTVEDYDCVSEVSDESYQLEALSDNAYNTVRSIALLTAFSCEVFQRLSIRIQHLLADVKIQYSRNGAQKATDSPSGEDSRTDSNPRTSSGQSSNTQSSSGHNPSKLRKSSQNNNDGEGDNEDEESRRTSDPTNSTSDGSAKRRFACPFYKRDPRRHQGRRSCSGPGWTSLHRMKYVLPFLDNHRSSKEHSHCSSANLKIQRAFIPQSPCPGNMPPLRRTI